MSYLVLARKYRPRNFSEMVGQEHVVQALSNALSQQRLHHAYLFTGTRGVGKTTVSRILAKSLNCTGPDGQGGITAAPCGACPSCQAIDAGRFVDYTEMDAASNTGKDDVQQLLEQAVYKPVQGRFKVFMIDEVHMLSNAAFNAMLKTLEEPPEYLKFVLATTDPQKVPVTVLSRCLQLNLRPMAPETVMEQLARVLAAEQVPAQPQALRLLARAARGSMRDALSLTDQAIAFGNGQVDEASVRQMLGSVDRGVVFSLIDALAAGNGRAVVDLSEQLRAAGLSAAATLEDMAAALQRMAVRQAAPDWPADSADPDAQDIARLAAELPADETQLLYSLCIHGRAELGLAPDEYAGLTMALLRLLPFKRAAAEKKTLNDAAAPAAQPVVQPLRVRDLPPPQEPELNRPPAPDEPPPAPDVVELAVREAEAEPAPPPRPAAAAPGPRPVQATGEGDFWHALVQQLLEREAVTALARELALQSQLLERQDGQWTLRVENESLANPGVRERLQAALAEAGHPARLQVQVGPVGDSPSRRNAIAASRRLKAAEALLMADPFVQEMMRDFGAKIVPASIKPL
jgi:DNA polymerase-3 subunit gamma/tau